MRLKTLNLRGLTRFTEPVSIDFSALPSGLVALVGANGAGKTTILEAVHGALFRSLPSREGSLPNHCQGDAYIDLGYEFNGSTYRSLVKVDANRGTQEAYLFNHDGSQPLTNGKVRDYDLAVTSRLTTEAQFQTSVFCAQNRKGNFLDLSKAAKKDAIIEILQLSKLQQISEGASQRAKALEGEVALTRGKLSSLEEQLEGLDTIRAELATDTEAVADLEQGLEIAREGVKILTERESEIRAGLEKAETLRQATTDIRKDIEALTGQMADRQRKLTEAYALIRNAEAIRAAVDAAAVIQGRIKGLQADLAKATSEREAIIVRMEAHQAKKVELAETRTAYEAAKAKAGEAKAAALADVDQQIAALREALSAEVRKADKATNEIASQRKMLATLGDQAAVLAEVPCGDSFPSCKLIANAHGAKGRTGEVEAAIARLETDAKTLAENVGAIRLQVGKLTDDRAVLADQPVLETDEMKTLVERGKALRAEVEAGEAITAEAADASKRMGQIQAEIDHDQKRLAEAQADANRLPQVEAAEVRRDELEIEQAQLRADRDAKEARLADLQQQASDLPRESELQEVRGGKAQGEQKVRQFEAGIRNLSEKIAGHRARISDLEKVTPQRDALAATLAASSKDLAEWNHLARAFGRDGIQALEIDAAGPEVTAIVNDLLASCFGPRFALSFETTRERADGKGDREVFDVRVIDAERGREGEFATLSGGEKVILNEALSLGLAIFNARRSGKRWETLFRDETAGALDPENAQRYLAMLRRALVLSGAHQILFISHQAELHEQADARLLVADGRVEVEVA